MNILDSLFTEIIADILFWLIFSGSVIAFTKWMYNLATRSRVSKVLVRKYTIYDIFQSTLNSIDASRILLVKLHNGGGDFKVTSELKSTVIEEAYHGVKSIKQKWQNRDVDIFMVKVLSEMGEDSNEVAVSDVPEGPQRDLYQAEDIIAACFHFVKAEKRAMYFISVSFKGKEDKFGNRSEYFSLNPSQRLQIEDLVSSVKQLI